MKPKEDQVTSLELSKKLKELGFKQESLFYWVVDSQGGGESLLHYNDACSLCGWKYRDDENCSAFTVAELGEMLPIQAFTLRRAGNKWICEKDIGNFCWRQDGGNTPKDDKFYIATTEADARAKMLIYLKENNLID